MFAILPVFTLAFVVLAIVASDYQTRRVSYALGTVPSMAEIARELYESAVIDGAHARMMRREVSGLALSLDSLSRLSAPTWAIHEPKSPDFHTGLRFGTIPALVVAIGAMAIAIGLTTAAKAQDIPHDLVCHIRNSREAICSASDSESIWVCEWTSEGVGHCEVM